MTRRNTAREEALRDAREARGSLKRLADSDLPIAPYAQRILDWMDTEESKKTTSAEQPNIEEIVEQNREMLELVADGDDPPQGGGPSSLGERKILREPLLVAVWTRARTHRQQH